LLTIELNPGLEPMTVFNAGTAPMADVFQNTADLIPCTWLTTRGQVDEKKSRAAPLPCRSQ
jgi:hypothetical protein